MLKYFYIFITVTLFSVFSMKVFAATVKNNGLTVQLLIIAEGSARSNISLDTGQMITVCTKGCFITFSNKDNYAIKADDTIEIDESRVFFK
ncbi:MULTISPECIES: hypothetical protein [Bartonella]|uniref:FecR protein domain-containing protein n=4 Tax=Bartonella TaxID=773 RepID=A0A1S6XQX6_BARSR|nr:hypothetical protein [Bartonella schoenbuchensis]AQX30908.1 hypothetical protein BscR1v2_009790 [Bartonella schoenbuchensis R1]CDP80339.1 hypothetical protein BN1046_01267 [Bartonella schoenbuchensis]